MSEFNSIPWNITIGDTVYTGDLSDLQTINLNTIRLSGVMGATLGVCSLILLALLVIVTNKKSPLFVLNMSSIVCLTIRAGLFVGFLNSPANSIGFLATGIPPSSSRSTANISLAAVIMDIPLAACIQASLIAQLNAVCRSPNLLVFRRLSILFFSMLAVATSALFIYNAVVEHERYRFYYDSTYIMKPYPEWVQDLPLCLLAISVNLSCLVMGAKLCCAIRTRRRLGLKQFGVIHILFIMTCQSFIFPSIFIIYVYIKHDVDYMLHIARLLIVVSLPLATMWAVSANNSPKPSSSSLSFSRSPTISSDSSEETYAYIDHSHKIRGFSRTLDADIIADPSNKPCIRTVSIETTSHADSQSDNFSNATIGFTTPATKY